MYKFNFTAPVLPGKDVRSPQRAFEADMDGYRESRRRMGATLERVFLMPTPMGDFAIAYVEATKDFPEGMTLIATSDLPADRKFRELLQEIHGIDVTQPPPGPPPEVISDWVDPDVSERKPGMAFVAPLRPGATEAARAFAKEAFVNRGAEHAASRRALGVTHETIMLNSTPMGDMVCVYLEGDDPAGGNRQFAASQSPYDAWFKAECRKIFPEFVDFDVPLPPIETLWDQQLVGAIA